MASVQSIAAAAGSPIRLNVLGIGLWADRLPGWPAARRILRGLAPLPQAAARLPGSGLLPAAERRRAPATVSLALAVAEEACTQAGVDPARLPSVFSSRHGDLEITDYLCRVLAGSPTNLSPTRFHNSVHNAPAGYWTIGTGCMRPSTAMSGGAWSFAAGLVEAATQAVCERGPVLFVAYDMPAHGPLAAVAPSEGLLGAALVLAPADSGQARRVDLRLGPLDDPCVADEPCRGNPMSCGLALLRLLARDAAARVEFALSPTLSAHLAVHSASSDAPASTIDGTDESSCA